jgi:hypothetical protein
MDVGLNSWVIGSKRRSKGRVKYLHEDCGKKGMARRRKMQAREGQEKRMQ